MKWQVLALYAFFGVGALAYIILLVKNAEDKRKLKARNAHRKRQIKHAEDLIRARRYNRYKEPVPYVEHEDPKRPIDKPYKGLVHS